MLGNHHRACAAGLRWCRRQTRSPTCGGLDVALMGGCARAEHLDGIAGFAWRRQRSEPVRSAPQAVMTSPLRASARTRSAPIV
jgi:hypothetical protein